MHGMDIIAGLRKACGLGLQSKSGGTDRQATTDRTHKDPQKNA